MLFQVKGKRSLNMTTCYMTLGSMYMKFNLYNSFKNKNEFQVLSTVLKAYRKSGGSSHSINNQI